MAKKRGKDMDAATDLIAVKDPNVKIIAPMRLVRGELRYDEEQVTVYRSLRDDPLGRMRSRWQIGEAQYYAGRLYQREVEASGVGKMRSSGDLREHVDGGQIASDGITDRQMQAAKTLADWRRRLGARRTAIVEAVLIGKQTLREVSDAGRAMPGKRATRDVTAEFRAGLGIIARAAKLA